ncbi:unnamed protein product [Rhizoctonia solani]|uniref:NACHT domain-containing protein n=3 Tax=Rhizoctonia solani TaxID=456999 RepID=A0A8H2WJJ8_9AGAM|nr:vegetative incompatibility protein HET-E-1, putative [Rhizoctonia solani AG-3 Rhs1AP]KEP45947.1 putative vegetative incompatibility protein HET-E-1 [Rhizoctonia solani 123E]CAE6378817.1 unnamed protein product [Rhizoctonia solani]CAE6424612.1 unnamed protein product [Rhizoctonia solani]
MALRSLISKRKRNNKMSTGTHLDPGEWRGGKKSRSPSRSRSPITSGSTPGTSKSTHPIRPGQNSRSPSPIRHAPQVLGHNASTTVNLTPRVASRDPSNAAPTVTTSNENLTSTAWNGLEQTLQALRITTKVCPPLRSVVDELVLCLPLFEAAAKCRKDYEDLTTGLKAMVILLIQHLEDAASESITNSLTEIAEAMRREIESIGNRQSRDGLRRVLGSTSDDEDLIRRYRRIEQLFRQLQGEASLSAWSISSKHYVNTQLEGLRPAKLARYNSELSMEVSRRSCTENTRTEILSNLMKWSEDRSTASIYWMNGMAGTGKTTIAYSACVALEASKQLAGSFFCVRASPECRDAKRIVPTIAYQLARRSTPFRSALCKILEEDTDIGTGAIAAQLGSLLSTPLMQAKSNMPNNLVFVIDALDECDDPYILELFLGLLFRSVVDLPLKFFVTSRPEPVIRHRMMLESERSRSVLYLHEIERSLVQADIERYLREELASVSLHDGITQLAIHAGNLFIYAATAIRYIRPPGKFVDPRERLETILTANSVSSKSLLPIDTLYSIILTTAIDDEALELQEQERIRLVLWTVVCACEPVLISTIAAISGLGSKDRAIRALEPLRSVLHISEHSELATTLHASFPDYVLSQERSGRFACNVSSFNQYLSSQCFDIMKAQLRFNICNLKSSSTPDDQVFDLATRVTANISEELFYACRFWMNHLRLITIPDAHNLAQDSYDSPPFPSLNHFLSHHLLFWMEVLNLKKCTHIGIASISKLNTWLTRIANVESELSEYASDAQAFIIGYASRPISSYTPHIYLSALPFAPFLSHYSSRFQGLVKISGTALDKTHQAALSTWEYDSPVISTAFLPKGDRIVLGKTNGELGVQNIHDGKYVFQSLEAHKGPITSVGVSYDGAQIVTGSHDMTLCIWSACDGSLVSGPFKGHTNGVTSVAFSPDTMHIASGSDDCTVGIWVSHDAAVPMRRLVGHDIAVSSVSFSPDGTRIISSSYDPFNAILVWDLLSGAIVFTPQLPTCPGPATLAQYTSDGTFIVSFLPSGHACRSHHNLCLLDASNGRLFGQHHYEGVESIAISPEGDRIAGVINHTINIWDTNRGKLTAPFSSHTDQITSVSFSADGSRIISASNDHTVRLWNVFHKVRHVKSIPEINCGIDPRIVAFAPEQICIAIATSGMTRIRVVSFDSPCTPRITCHWQTYSQIKALQFSLDATRIFSVHASGTMYIWDARTLEIIDGPYSCTSNYQIETAECTMNGVVITYYQGVIEICDALLNRSITFSGPHYSGVNLVLSQAGKRLLTNINTTTGSSINVWDGANGTRVRVAGSISSLERRKVLDLSPDGTYAAYCPISKSDSTYGCIQLINTGTGDIISMPGGSQVPEFQKSTFSLARFSPDGPYVACVMNNGCYVWNTCEDTVVNIATDLGTTLRSFSYASNGWCMATGMHNSTVFRARQFHINQPLFTIRSDGWIVDDQSQLLFWVPAEVRDEFPRSNGMDINESEVLLSVDYSNMLVGEEWSKCYLGD